MKKIFSLLSVLFSLSLFAQNFTLKEPYEVAEYIKKFGPMGEILAYKDFDIPLDMPLPQKKFLDPEFKLFRYQVDDECSCLCVGYSVGEVYQYYLKKKKRPEEISFRAIFDFGNTYFLSNQEYSAKNHQPKDFPKIFFKNLGHDPFAGASPYLTNYFFSSSPLIFKEQYPGVKQVQKYLRDIDSPTTEKLWKKFILEDQPKIKSLESLHYPYHQDKKKYYEYYQYGAYKENSLQIKGKLKSEEDFLEKALPLGNDNNPQTTVVLKDFNPDVLRALIVKGFPPIVALNSVSATTESIQIKGNLTLKAFKPTYQPYKAEHVIVFIGYGYHNDKLYFLTLDAFYMKKDIVRPIMYFAKDLKNLITTITIIPGLTIDDEPFYIKDIQQ